MQYVIVVYQLFPFHISGVHGPYPDQATAIGKAATVTPMGYAYHVVPLTPGV